MKRKQIWNKNLFFYILLIIFCIIFLPFLLNFHLGNTTRRYAHNSNFTKAIKIQKKLYLFDKNFLGKTNEYTIVALENLAYTNLIYGDYDNAYKLYLHSYQLREQRKEKKFAKISVFKALNFENKYFETLGALAYLSFLTNNTPNAKHYLEEALKASQKTSGMYAKSYKIFAITNLLDFSIDTKNNSDINKYFSLLMENLGKDYLTQNDKDWDFKSIITLAKYYSYLNNKKEVEKIYNVAIKEAKTKDKYEYIIYDFMALFYQRNKELKKSNDYIVKGLNAKIKISGQKPDITAMGDLFAGYLFYQNDEIKLAKNELEKNLKVKEKIFYPKSPTILCSRYYINKINNKKQDNYIYLYKYANNGQKLNLDTFCNRYIEGSK